MNGSAGRLLNELKYTESRRFNVIQCRQTVLNFSQIDTMFRFFFSVALRPNAGHGLLILDVSRSHTTTHHSR